MNWRYIKKRDNSNIWPWARGFFSYITFYVFFLNVKKGSEEEKDKAFFAMTKAQAVILSSLFLVFNIYPADWEFYASILPVLPFLLHINRLNANNPRAVARASAWRFRHVFMAILAPVWVVSLVLMRLGYLSAFSF